jgi:hypothetical protein
MLTQRTFRCFALNQSFCAHLIRHVFDVERLDVERAALLV